MDFFEKHLSSTLQAHVPYVPGKQPSLKEEVLKLNTNENPYPPSKSVKNAIFEEIEKLRLYPNPQSLELRTCIAELHNLSQEQIIIGNGSDDILNLCMRCFTDHQLKAGMLDPSYSLYKSLASIQGSQILGVPFKDDNFDLPIREIIESNANIFFLTSPHAPSGKEFELSSLKQILNSYEGIMVLDEAYVDFAKENAVSLLNEYDNLIVSRSLSKSYSLAGLRVGYAMSSPKIISILDQAREVYNLDRLAQVGAQAVLKDRKYFEFTKEEIIKTRDQFYQELISWGWKTIPSGTNFLFTQPVGKANERSASVAGNLFEFLLSNKILIRYFPENALTSSYVRISIGKASEISILIDKIKLWQDQEIRR